MKKERDIHTGNNQAEHPLFRKDAYISMAENRFSNKRRNDNQELRTCAYPVCHWQERSN